MPNDLQNLKESIEMMTTYHQIEVLKLLRTMPTAPINENQNGTFINLSILLDKDIEILKEYVEYVKDQQKTLLDMETKKQNLQNKYFKDNKDIFIGNTNG